MRVRRAVPGDEATLRRVRLRALADAPGAFGSTYARELARTEADWQRWLSPAATFLLEGDEGPAGIVAGLKDDADPEVVWLLSLWVEPGCRGLGGADALVDAVVRWARAEGAAEVRLQVVETNQRARRFYERLGFRANGRQTVRERDGALELEMSLLRESPRGE
jgi:ribosomal protein S18 acetylase RimI-like enzyme